MTRSIPAVTTLGPVALEVLSTRRDGRCMGATSRGLFLQTSSPWLVFLSWEPWRGPQTANLDRRLEGPAPGDPVRIDPEGLELSGVRVDWSSGRAWQVPDPPGSASSAGVRHERALRLLAEARRRGRESSLAHLLEAPELPDPVGLLGLGPGLTPSGDDVVLGMLLAGSRRTGPRPSEGLVAAARKRTTTLAANLLELAARGEADERLLEAADHVVAGSPCGLAFLDWGAHSGTDFLVGLALEARMPEGWEQVYTFDPDRRPQGP